MLDEDTQRLIERARQRREMLNQRAANLPEAAPRKRRTPVLDSDRSEMVLSEKQVNQDDSPKRQCLRDTEQNLKPDTPAIRGVHARAKDLTGKANEENMGVVPKASPRKSVSSPPLTRRAGGDAVKTAAAGTPASARKSRFAALAANIGQWEDDTAHHAPSHKDREEDKRPRWQPPSSPTKSAAATPTNVGSPARFNSPSKINSPAKVNSPAKINSPAKVASPKKTPAPSVPSAITSASSPRFVRNSPLRGSKVELNRSPKPFSPSYDDQPSAKISKSENAFSSVSKSATPFPSKSLTTVTQQSNSIPQPMDVDEIAQPSNNRTPDPSKKPMSAKLASFEQKIVQNTPMSSGLSKSTFVPKTPKQVCTPALSASTPARTNFSASTPAPGSRSAKKSVDPTDLPVAQRMSQMQGKLANVATPGSAKKEAEPTAFSVTARMSAWEDMTSSNMVSNIKKVDPGNPTPKKADDISSTPNTRKAGSATRGVHQRLAAAVAGGGGTTGSQLAEQHRQQRMQELQAISNRWKNGVLREDVVTGSQNQEQNSESVDEEESSSPRKAVNSKREASRNRAREDFKSKLADIGLDNEESKSGNVPALQKSPSKKPGQISGTPSKNQTGSIYSIINKNKNKTETSQNDSFNDSDDESAKLPQAVKAARQEAEFKRPLPLSAGDLSETTDATDTDANSIVSSSDVADDDFGSSDRLPMEVTDDDISLRGFVSEAVRRESVAYKARPGMQPADREASLDSMDDMPSSSRASGYQAESDSDDQDDSDSGDAGAVDDLLDEALSCGEDVSDDGSVSAKGEFARPQRPDDYDPDMDPNNVVLRRKPKPATRYQASVSSTDDDDECRPYSLEAYRKSANLHMQKHDPIVRASRWVGRTVTEDADLRDPETPMPAPRAQRSDRRAVQDRIQELQELVSQEQSVIMQTSNALNKCCLGNSYFAGSAEQVECNRVLLIACQKRQSYMTEIQRLKDSAQLHSEGPGPQGSLTISDIRLPLKKDFVTKIGTSQDLTVHYFILLVRNGCQVITTQMLSTHDPLMRGSLDFPNLIKINGITGNFKLTIDIYTMSISREPAKDKKRRTPKKTPKKGGYAMALESPGGPSAVRTTSFSHVTSLPLTMKCLDKSSFHLDRLPYLSPLYGQIFMRLKCLMESNVEERGFLTMFDDVSGFGAWHRRWVVLAGNKLCVWKYPDDETRKDPMFLIDLKRCITEKVGLVSRDVCARPNTFDMVTVRQPLKGERDTLVTQTHSTVTTVRHQMSADSKEERIVWCNKLNRALANLRTWNADALKPHKSSSSSRR